MILFTLTQNAPHLILLPMSKKAISLQQFVDSLGSKNMTVAQWSRENKFDRHAVYGVLRGRLKGRRGVTRQIMERMGVKPPPTVVVRASKANS